LEHEFYASTEGVTSLSMDDDILVTSTKVIHKSYPLLLISIYTDRKGSAEYGISKITISSRNHWWDIQIMQYLCSKYYRAAPIS